MFGCVHSRSSGQGGGGRRRIALGALLLSWTVAPWTIHGEQVILEDFSAPVPAGIAIEGSSGPCGSPADPGTNSACVDDVQGWNGGKKTGRLVLTPPATAQTGHAWLERIFDPRSERIQARFDIHVFGSDFTPADGLSFVILLGTDHPILGAGGASLGTGGLPVRRVSVAIDLRDSGAADPESDCDDVGSRTCHVEVSETGDPARDPPLAISTRVPDVLAAGNAGIPVTMTVALNGREVTVTLATEHAGFGAQEVIHSLLAEEPAGPAVVGIVGTSGDGNSALMVDNLVVDVEPVTPLTVAWEPPATVGGVNCGGPEVSISVGGEPIDLSADSTYGSIAEIQPASPPRFVLRGTGRIPVGDDGDNTYDAPITSIPSADLEPVFQAEATSARRITYRNRVIPGRYDVTLCFAENCPCGVDARGLPLRRFDVRVAGEPVLWSFSPAEAAGEDLGYCSGLLAVGVTRTFSVDVRGVESDLAFLDIEVDDLGGSPSPGDAQINGYFFRWTGEPSGQPADGDIQDRRRPAIPAFGAPRTLVDLDFEQGPSTPDALEGIATVNGGRFFTPGIIAGRLRLGDTKSFLSATSVIFDGDGTLVIDPLATKVEAEFDIFFAKADGALPADGLVFGIIATDDPTVTGGPGGSLGFADIGFPGIGVEVDLWEDASTGDESGYNTVGWGHVAVVGSGGSAATVEHVQDQDDLDPSLRGENWVDLFSPAGFHMEVLYSPEARVQAYITAMDGSFPRRKILDTFITPFRHHRALLGFFAATGGKTATMEVDDLHIRTEDCIDAAETASIHGEETQQVQILPGASSVLLLDGTESAAGEGEVQSLLHEWTVEGPFGGAAIQEPCRATTPVVFSVPGIYAIRLDVDDLHCGRGPQATDTITVIVKEAVGGPAFVRGDTNGDGNTDISDAVSTLNVLFLGSGAMSCPDASDTNDDGNLDISDAVTTLNFLFLGGEPPADPFPLCGVDAVDDVLSCEGSQACS